MPNLQAAILQALRSVQDPDLKRDLVSLGMIDQLLIKDHTISFTIILTTPACPLQEILKQECIQAIRTQVTTDFNIAITTTAKVTTGHATASVLLPHVKNIIAIASGKGGVGKSTLTTHLALALVNYGVKVGILDADIFGPSIPTMWGCRGVRPPILEQEGKKYIQPIERYHVKLMSIGFLAEEAVVWRGPMASAALKQLLKETKWGPLDYLLIDLPPGTGDIPLTLVQTVAVTGVVVVTTPQKVALIDAVKAIAMFTKAHIKLPILGLVENMSYFLPTTAQNTIHYIFGKEGGKQLAQQKAIPFLGQIPLLPAICQQGDDGISAVDTLPIFDTIAQKVAQQISIQNAKATF
ncbi:Mrp/NBP35 family ATP-binding protein [Candidatus Cardinium hertigii]|uniref:Iron-sulfur cluster carrier protein n=1 Tax=Candidatus Cardinium hertigii TaxID=247481 RepID=A0A2Z3LII6_9BACT|nr:Mrp/NBP35 family ATP-binding protein [Candidatus Cardinium hertigii]AWN81870.1 Iron-sulfur cluster carrier protein [Candidatus Cardinium hertigii]